MTHKQQILFDYTREHGKMTKAEAVDLIGGTYYCNASKHTGDVLSRMVKSGHLRRVQKGVYELGSRIRKTSLPDNQLNIFE